MMCKNGSDAGYKFPGHKVQMLNALDRRVRNSCQPYKADSLTRLRSKKGTKLP